MKHPCNILNLDDTRFMSKHVVQFDIGRILKSIDSVQGNYLTDT